MKATKYYLINAQVKQNIIQHLNDLPLDGSVTVTISPTGSKSAKQRGLQHIWYNDVINSGLGGEYESDKESLDLYAKWRWCLDILCRDENFADMFLDYHAKHKDSKSKMRWFITNHVHTEDLSNNEMAEFLTEFQRHYSELGVNLTDPAAQGLEKLLRMR